MTTKPEVLRQAATAAGIDWPAVYQEALPKIFHFFCYRVGDTAVAEDLTAATLEKAWVARERYQPAKGNLWQWLFGIAQHVAVDYFRRRRDHLPLEQAARQAAEGSLEQHSQQRTDFNRLAALLRQLPAGDQELVALKYGAGLTNRAMAELLGISESNVGTRLHRTVQRLRAQWEETP